jgi:hypothetical protein
VRGEYARLTSKIEVLSRDLSRTLGESERTHLRL